MTTPEFSVVVPVHNREVLLRRALDSVLAQTWVDFEVIVVDDGSTDGSFESAAAFDDNRVKVLRQPQQGAAAARNLGAWHATGRFLTFLDSDDEVEATWLEDFHRLLDAPEVEVASCGVRYEHLDGTLDRVDAPGRLEGLPQSPPVMFRHGGSYALSLATFQSVGGFDERLPASQHTELAYRVLSSLGPRARFACRATPKPLLRYRIGSPDGIRSDDLAVMVAAARIAKVHRDSLTPAMRARYHAIAANRAARLGERRRAAAYGRATLRDEPTLGNVIKATATVILPANFWTRRASSVGSSAAPSYEPRASQVSFLSLQSQYHNFGDVVLLQALVRRLAARGDVVVRTKDVPDSVVAAVLPDISIGVKQIDGSLLRSAVLAALRTRVSPQRAPHPIVWMKPGHMTVGGSDRRPIVVGSLLRVIRALGGDTVRIGISVQLGGAGARWPTRYFVRSFSLLGTRDESSKRILEDLGAKRVLSGPDLALADLSPPDLPSASESATGHILVTFSLRDPSRIADADPRLAAKVRTALEELSWWLLQHGDVSCSVHAQVAGDLSFTTGLLRLGWEARLPSQDFEPGEDTLQALLENLRRSDIVVTNRLHVALFGLVAGTVPVVLVDPSAQSKISNYLNEWGLSDLVIDATQSGAAIRGRFEEILEGRSALQARCRDTVVRTLNAIDGLHEQVDARIGDRG